MYYILKMEIVHIYVSPQRRPQATGHETPFFAFFRVWGGGDVNVPVNLLTSCMLRELRVCLGYLYIYTYTQYYTIKITFRYIYICKHLHTYTFIFTIVYIQMYIYSCYLCLCT